MGRVGNKEYKSIKNDSFLCSISLATSKKYKDSQGVRKEITNWHHVNFFNKLADIANKYAHVGDLIYVEGEISNKKIDDNGVTRMVHSIIGTELKLIPSSKKREIEKNDSSRSNNFDYEIPF